MISSRLVPFLFAFVACAAQAQSATGVDALRDRYPAQSIDSIEKADAALAATAAAKTRVEQAFKAAARACIGKVLVNNCLDAARDERRRSMADIGAIELEANRFKRRERADRLEQDRSQREADRAAKAPADAALRERNRQAYEQKQTDAARSAVDREKSDANRTTKRRPAPKPPESATKQAERERNAVEFRKKTQNAAEHEQEIARRLAQKAADRKRRDEAKAAKDAKDAKTASVGAAAAAQAPLPPISGTKP